MTSRPTSRSEDEEYEDLLWAQVDSVAILTLNRPERRNALNRSMARSIIRALRRADGDDEIRAVVITGAGDDFCVGADLSGGSSSVKRLLEIDRPERPADFQEGAGIISVQIHHMLKPVIAAVNGAAIGAGATIATSMDLRLATEQARFGYVFTRRGLTPEGASTWFLPRLVGLGRALDWTMSGRIFGVDEALAAGLLCSVHPTAGFLDVAVERARQLVDGTSPQAVALTRRLIRTMSAFATPREASLVESRLFWDRATSADIKEGISSFLERRTPQFDRRVAGQMPEWLEVR